MKEKDDTLRIAYIGDSWAYMHNNQNCQIQIPLEDTLHRPVRVHSYGICGLTSKEIYEHLFEDKSYKLFIQSEGFSYCYISAGINDTYKKLSTTYYKKSMDGIIQLLLANNIRPIIQEIPDYDIPKTFHRQSKSKKALRYLSMFVNNTSKDCKEDYRNVLNELIAEKGYQDKVSVIRYKSWNNDYLSDLHLLFLGDGMHLNQKGYFKLDSAIYKEILTIYLRNSELQKKSTVYHHR
jgi:lysophospholipase L1-like esterase